MRPVRGFGPLAIGRWRSYDFGALQVPDKLDEPSEPNEPKPVLIVEDDDDLRETLQECLQGEGFRVLAAANGKEALALLRSGEQPPAFLLLDLMMPVMNGWELLAAIQRENIRVPLAVCSAATHDLPKHVMVIRKPYTISSLVEAIARACS